MIPRQPRKGTALAPDQIFSDGYRDGLNHRTPHSRFRKSLHYFKGYFSGCRFIPDRARLIPFFQSHSLETALQSIHLWEQDQGRFGFGRVALGQRNGWWLVLFSQDLQDTALPF